MMFKQYEAGDDKYINYWLMWIGAGVVLVVSAWFICSIIELMGG